MEALPTIATPSISRPPLRIPGAAATGLTDETLREASQRLQAMGLVALALWVLYFLLDTWIIPALRQVPPHFHLSAHLVCLVGILLSVLVFGIARFGRLGPQPLYDLGLLYMVSTAALIARLNVEAYLQDGITEPGGLSWVCVLVVLHPMVLPNTPRRTLAAALVAASLDPLFFTIAVWRQTGALLPASYVLVWHHNFICAGLSVVPSRLIAALSRKVQRAQELGSYQLLERLGAGGMGEVWKARHSMLARPAAIKIIRPQSVASDAQPARTTLRRFEREAQATALLQSPHTIEIFDFGLERDGTFYYVMELLHGFDLDTLVKRFGPLPSERAVHLLVQVCHSLEDAHRSGLVHRDVKPANLFTCRKGQDVDFVKVLDFGLVKSERPSQEAMSQATLQGSAPGTPGFMAPEQLLGEPRIDPRADLYALGCVAYWLLTAKPVFEADTTMKLLLRHVQDAPQPPSQLSEIPVAADLEALVLQCLEKDPARRPASARALAAGLRACRVDAAWDEARAQAWWQTHAPERSAEPEIASVSRGVGS